MYDTHELLIGIQKNIDDENSQKNTAIGNLNKIVKPQPASLNIHVGKILGTSNERYLRQQINPYQFYKHMPIALNTETAEQIENSEIGWSFSNGQFNARRGVVSSKDLVKNIIGMRVSDGYFPFSPYMTIPYNGQIYVLVKEFAAQSFSAKNFKYHFVLMYNGADSEPVTRLRTQYTLTKPVLNGYYWFPSFIQDINSITLQFASSTGYFNALNVPIQADCLSAAIDYKQNPMILEIQNVECEIVNGMTYYFVGAQSNNVLDNAVVAQINQQIGHPITKITDTRFSIPIDGTLLVGNLTSCYVWVVPLRNDFTMKIDLIYLGDNDNSA